MSGIRRILPVAVCALLTAGVASSAEPSPVTPAEGVSSHDRKASTQFRCSLAGTAPCARLVRSTSRGRATPGQRVSVSGRTVTRRAGAVRAGRSINVRLDMNAATRGRVTQILIRRTPGLTGAHVRILRRKGFTKCTLLVKRAWIIVGCRRSTKRTRGLLVVRVRVPATTTATAFRAVAAYSGSRSRGQVLTRIRRAPTAPPGPGALPARNDPTSADVCLPNLTLSGVVNSLVLDGTGNRVSGTGADGKPLRVDCWYSRSGTSTGANAGITVTMVFPPAAPVSGRCPGRPAPGFLGEAGFRASTTSYLDVRVVNLGVALADRGAVADAALARAEGAGVAIPCTWTG